MSAELSKGDNTLLFMKRKPTLIDGSVRVESGHLSGKFRLENVSFEYPSQPGLLRLNNLK
jgi:hypothetical protein